MKSEPILVTDDDYLPILLQLLEHAQTSVDIIAFSFAIGSAAGTFAVKSAPYQIARKLAEIKKSRGTKIKIRLYLEGRRETSDRNRVTGDFLKACGVKVKYGSTHAKGFCVDGRYVLFGSTNLTNQSILKNYETNLLFDEPSVTEGFEKYFEHLWKGGKHGGVRLKAPMYADGAFKDVILSMIDGAKRSLEFSIYFFHHTELETAFVRAAKRGVKVVGLIHHHEMFALSYVRRTRGTAKRLIESGIKNIHFGPASLFTHSKYLIQDRKVIALGTGNWLHEDMKVHPQLYVQFENGKLAKKLALHLRSQILKTK